jgi:diadenylate cyclase
MFESILCQVTEYDPDVLESLIELAVEIAREGREGRRLGTLITFGDENAVLARSRPLILDPLSGHPKSSLHVTNPNLRGTIKELAQLDGGFVVSGEGIFPSACRYLDAVAKQVDVPLGLGSRHIAAANMSAVTKAVGIVGFREFGGETFLSWTTGRRNYSRDLDDGSCPAGWHR